MSKGLNKATLIGHLGKDVELKYTPNGTAVANFSLAVSESYKNESGEWVEKTEWFNVVAWKKTAETCSNYLRKGSKVYLEGKITNESYEKDGEKKYITKIVAQNLVFLDKKGDVQNEVSENAIELTEEETKGLGKPDEDDVDSLPF